MADSAQNTPPEKTGDQNAIPVQALTSGNSDHERGTTPSESNQTEGDTQENGKKKDEPPQQSVSMANYFRILSYTNKKDRMVLAVGVICAVASGVPLPIMNIIFGGLVGTFLDFFTPGNTVSESSFKSEVSKLSLYIVYLFIAKFVLTYFAMLSFRITGLRVSASLRLEYMQSLFFQPISTIDQLSVGSVTNTITTLSNSIQQSIADKLAILLQSLALVITAYVIAFTYSWALTLVTSASLLFILIFVSLILPPITKTQQSVDKADEKHSSISGEVLSSIRTVCSLGAEKPLSAKYGIWVQESRKCGQRLAVLLGVNMMIIFFSIYCSYALAFWFGLKLFREGHIANINTVIIVFFSVMLVVSILGSIASPLMMITKAVSASASFFEIMDAQKVDTSGLREPEASAEVDIVFQDAHFAYPTRPDVSVLKNMNARFQRGKTTALVGPSGSGKSTIVAMVERWYRLNGDDGQQGSILVGDHNINSLDLKWWRSQIGLVQQEPFLFNNSIFENVAFGLIGTKWENESDEVKKQLVEEACREAFAEEFILRLPEGYATEVGESGIKLSGGQRQRLAIARSIIKQPTILVLDEATSAIDVRGERIVQAALEKVSQNRTTIVIAHRLSTVQQADHIIVMKAGVNVEQGTHEELLDIEDGVYRGLVNAQQLELSTEADEDSTESLHELKEEGTAKTMSIYEPEDRDANAENTKAKGFFGTIGLMLWEQRTHWPLYILAVFACAGAGAAYALQSWLFAQLLVVFTYTGQKLSDAANFWSLMFFILALAVGAFYFLFGFAAHTISMRITATYRMEYFQNTLKKPMSFYDLDDNSSGSLMGRLTTDPKQVQEILGLNGALPLVSIFNILGCIAIAFSFGWKLSLVAVFAALPVIFFAAFMRIRFEVQFEAMNAKVYNGSSQFAAEAISAFRTVSSLAMEDTILDRYSNLLQDQQKKAFHKAWYATLVFAFSDSIELCAMALTFWYGGQLLATREYEPTTFFVIYMAIIQSGQHAGQFFSYGSNFAQGIASANRILKSRLGIHSEDHSNTDEKQALTLKNDVGASVELRNVAFKYPSRDTPLFTGLNVDIKGGQFVAFVGPSGCGKTSVISMLERFYDPIRGTILVNGHDISSIDLASYRRALSLVAQEPKLFEGTIRENVTLGLNDSDFSDDEIAQVCKDAEIHDFITSLPQSYATELGVKAQASMSGGQRQRLCIARALLRKPSLLLLDEATSSLDSQSEKTVQAAIENLAGKKSMTIVAVAHRLATIQKADAIFVFGEGQPGRGSGVVEHGTHQELLRKRGAYWQMCQEQALDR
ncbi:lipid A export ATP-binding/permease protein msbA [Aspergillus steynii IBT 23096]|uniref:Lipid A export ATP-binding/permease protein msbA n=1 Tax=Aspergillus steynii IBT 23096 TaxID=1392250 RepID=A0A2I2G142_9EURO|nr:lipid A export ATP-binding/permease protein msbA [Aspergillus steynii IBT 23096]PLB46602.1 lipid A export ATP-binding/permease protein msbA [Aspergillus steynii IBT 23096]